MKFNLKNFFIKRFGRKIIDDRDPLLDYTLLIQSIKEDLELAEKFLVKEELELFHISMNHLRETFGRYENNV